MTRIRREQEKLARIPESKLNSCTVEALGRELVHVLNVENAYEGSNPGWLAENRRESIIEAGSAFKARSPLGVLFQLMLVAEAAGNIQGHCVPNDEVKRAQERLTSCLHSVAEFLEAHFKVNRDDVAGDYGLCAEFSPFSIATKPIQAAQDRAA
jgi:hypothetical protein